MISLRKLFQQGGPGSGHHDHRGRPGEQGGSLPEGGGSGGAFESDKDYEKYAAKRRAGVSVKDALKGKFGSFDTPKKTANAISKITGERIGTGFGQRGVLSGRFSKGDAGSIGTALMDGGFEKYSDPYKQDWVTSYKKGSLRVHLDTKGNRITISETSRPSIPYD